MRTQTPKYPAVTCIYGTPCVNRPNCKKCSNSFFAISCATCDGDEHLLQYRCYYHTVYIYGWQLLFVSMFKHCWLTVLEICFWGPGEVLEVFVTKSGNAVCALAVFTECREGRMYSILFKRQMTDSLICRMVVIYVCACVCALDTRHGIWS